ncbi:MAG TPA: DUF305 domain-containing protein, partial [Acidimicrobiales bacterium]
PSPPRHGPGWLALRDGGLSGVAAGEPPGRPGSAAAPTGDDPRVPSGDGTGRPDPDGSSPDPDGSSPDPDRSSPDSDRSAPDPHRSAPAPAPDPGRAGGGPTWAHVAVAAAAVAFTAFAAGLFVARDRPPGATSVEVGFLQDMITHHDQALRVAALTIAYGDDPTVRSYANEVVAFQSYEIGLMTEKLRAWGHRRGERSGEAMAWMGMPVPVEQMPGLLSDEQMDDIRAARGGASDRLFLELMAEHHRGGLHMAEAAASLAGDDEVAALAARMARNQAGEINEYRMAAEALGLDLDIPPARVPAGG